MSSTPRPFQSALLGITLSLAVAGSGCSKSDSASNPGGSTGSAGKAGSSSQASSGGGGGSSSAGAGAGGSCPAATPCGGDLVGTWNVSSSCLKIAGEIEMTTFGAACKTAKITGSLKVTGSFTARANKSYLDNTVTTGEEQLDLEPSCLIISSTPTDCSGAAGLLKGGLGLSTLDCTPVNGGGCTCKGTVQQNGMMGMPSGLASPDGAYATSGSVLTYDDYLEYSYCVSNDRLTVTPKPAGATFTGAIIFQKDSTSTGGTSGSGGQTTGGTKASGGTTAAAGASGGQVTSGGARTGGTTASGGTAGGQVASGGTRVGGTSAAAGASGGSTAAGGSSGTAGTTATGTGPCDIYEAANTPCVAAHSVVRALFGSYRGKLYQISKTDGTTLDVLTGSDGIADTKPEDTFCTGSTCSLTVIYDQTKNANDLWWQGSEKVPAPKSSTAAKATADSVTVAGHKVYSAFIKPGNCYWHDGSKSGMAIDAEPEGMYMVTSARNTNGGCCYDYGNSETTRAADVGGAMDALNISSITAWGTGAGNGPWIMADLEWGVFCQAATKKNNNCPTQTAPFVTAILKNNGTTEYALRGSDATAGALTTYYKGKSPYNPMKKQGAIILGCGGDCCKPCTGCGSNASSGIFFEGAIVKGYPTDAAEDDIQKNIAAAGYGK
jgi:non-reducing end alpha-L-arabinofuranosidase